MSAFSRVLDHVEAACARRGRSDLFFRGHADATWPLIPSAGRKNVTPSRENRILNKFAAYSAHLVPAGASKWDLLFLMQHHGVPTRLLDWTDTFAIALYFAVRDKAPRKDAALWILDPYTVNEKWYKHPVICNLHDDFPHNYAEYFAPARVEDRKPFPTDVVAIFSNSLHPRMRSQRAYFTLHRDVQMPLERSHPDCLDEVLICDDCILEARRFITHAGINDYTLFPDLDGLARMICQEELGQQLHHGRGTNGIEVLIRDFKPDESISKAIMHDLLRVGVPRAFFQRGMFDETPDKNETILVGRRVPIDLAKKVIRTATRRAPFLKYVRHYEGVERSILIGGKTDLSLNAGARALEPDEVAALVKDDTTAAQFHSMLDSFVTKSVAPALGEQAKSADSPPISGEEDRFSFGKVVRVTPIGVTVLEYDFSSDCDKEIEYLVSHKTEYGNVAALGDLRVGDNIVLDYTETEGKRTILILVKEEAVPSESDVTTREATKPLTSGDATVPDGKMSIGIGSPITEAPSHTTFLLPTSIKTEPPTASLLSGP